MHARYLKKGFTGTADRKTNFVVVNNRYSNFCVTTIKYIIYKVQDLNVPYMLLPLQTRFLTIFFLCVNHII